MPRTLAWIASLAVLAACDSSPPAPDATAPPKPLRLAPHPSTKLELPAHPAAATPLPSGYYTLVAKRISDTCSPPPSIEGTFEVFVRGRVVGKQAYVTAPFMSTTAGLVSRRIDMRLRDGETLHNSIKLHPPSGTATATFDTTLTEPRPDGFTVRVTEVYAGIEGDPKPAGETTPKASCRSEHELRYTLAKELCPARCAMDGPMQPDGGAPTECTCGDGGV